MSSRHVQSKRRAVERKSSVIGYVSVQGQSVTQLNSILYQHTCSRKRADAPLQRSDMTMRELHLASYILLRTIHRCQRQDYAGQNQACSPPPKSSFFPGQWSMIWPMHHPKEPSSLPRDQLKTAHGSPARESTPHCTTT